MRLVYKECPVCWPPTDDCAGKPHTEVRVGDLAICRGETYIVEYFREPHKPGSSGKITTNKGEFYVGVIGAEWIEREDRDI